MASAETLTLRQKANNNTKEQFANSPELRSEILNAVIGASHAHNAASRQAPDSQRVCDGLQDALLNQAGLSESLREQPALGGENDGDTDRFTRQPRNPADIVYSSCSGHS